MSDNPFAEPGDPDRTVIRPMPGHRAGAIPAGPTATQAAAHPAAQAAAQVGPDLETIAGRDPLATAAMPLLQLLARLRNTATPPDAGDMRERTRRELRSFERRARAAGVTPEHLRLAHYALCAALDDVVLATPWGAAGRWKEQPLSVVLHQDEQSGDGFFEQLRAVRAALPASLPVLELMVVCLALGMTGRYRALPDGAAQLERIRHHLFELIAKTAAPLPTTLAPDTAGVDARFVASRNAVPLWVGASVALAVIGGAYAWTLTNLNARSDMLFQTALAAPPAAMPRLARPPATPPPPPPPAPVFEPPQQARLQAAIADMPGVELVTTPAETILRIPAQALFPQPNARLVGGPLPDRLAAALRDESGPIRILAYSDATPTRSVGFPSNFALTSARAKALRAALARKLPDASRIAAEGRADADPLAPNDTAQGRERNRRIEILLPRPA